MGSKKVLPVYQLITNGSMTGTATITSRTVNITNIDNVGLQVGWTGTAVGTVTVNASLDNVNFDALVFNPGLQQPAGVAGNYLISLNQLPFPYINVVYVNASSTGTLNVFIVGKDLN